MGKLSGKRAMVDNIFELLANIPSKFIFSSFNHSCFKAFNTESSLDNEFGVIVENESIQSQENAEVEGRYRNSEEYSSLEQLILDADVTSCEIGNFEKLNLDSDTM